MGSGSFPSPQGLSLASVILIDVAGTICPHLYHSACILGQCLPRGTPWVVMLKDIQLEAILWSWVFAA